MNLQILQKETALLLGLPNNGSSSENWKIAVTHQINDWLNNDFNRLLSVLYRIDVSEEKLKQALKENPHIDAGKIILDLIVERLTEKEESRKRFRQRDNDIDEREKW